MIGWSTWIFSVVAGALLLCVNTFLLHSLRAATGGGRVRTLDAASDWRGAHWLLLRLIKVLLFCLSFVISNSVFFALFFGAASCPFSRTGGSPVCWTAEVCRCCRWMLCTTLPSSD